MANLRNSNFTGYGAIQFTGESETVNSQAINGLQANNNGDLLFCYGTVTVTDGGTGYAKGCIYIKTDVVTGTGGVYFNKGTNTSCAFTLATQA